MAVFIREIYSLDETLNRHCAIYEFTKNVSDLAAILWLVKSKLRHVYVAKENERIHRVKEGFQIKNSNSNIGTKTSLKK